MPAPRTDHRGSTTAAPPADRGSRRRVRPNSAFWVVATVFAAVMAFSTIPAPFSSYSFREIHIWWNVPKLAKMLPPIQEPKRLSVVRPAACSLILTPG